MARDDNPLEVRARALDQRRKKRERRRFAGERLRVLDKDRTTRFAQKRVEPSGQCAGRVVRFQRFLVGVREALRGARDRRCKRVDQASDKAGERGIFFADVAAEMGNPLRTEVLPKRNALTESGRRNQSNDWIVEGARKALHY